MWESLWAFHKIQPNEEFCFPLKTAEYPIEIGNWKESKKCLLNS